MAHQTPLHRVQNGYMFKGMNLLNTSVSLILLLNLIASCTVTEVQPPTGPYQITFNSNPTGISVWGPTNSGFEYYGQTPYTTTWTHVPGERDVEFRYGDQIIPTGVPLGSTAVYVDFTASPEPTIHFYAAAGHRWLEWWEPQYQIQQRQQRQSEEQQRQEEHGACIQQMYDPYHHCERNRTVLMQFCVSDPGGPACNDATNTDCGQYLPTATEVEYRCRPLLEQ